MINEIKERNDFITRYSFYQTFNQLWKDSDMAVYTCLLVLLVLTF